MNEFIISFPLFLTKTKKREKTKERENFAFRLADGATGMAFFPLGFEKLSIVLLAADFITCQVSSVRLSTAVRLYKTLKVEAQN